MSSPTSCGVSSRNFCCTFLLAPLARSCCCHTELLLNDATERSTFGSQQLQQRSSRRHQFLSTAPMPTLTTIFMLSLSVLDTKKGRMQASHRRPKETPPRSTPVINDRKQDEVQRVQRVEGADAAKMFGVARTDYAPWVLHPEQINAMAHTLVLTGERSDSHGHVVLLRQLTKLVGLHDPELMGGLDTARRLEAAGKPFVMMTLTNDHLPSSEKDHDRALNWERANCTASAWDAIFIGPPGSSMLEGPRKSWFCEQSEMLAWETGNPWNRFTLPCATRQTPYDNTQYRTAFEALLSQPAALLRSSRLQQGHHVF